MKEKDYEVNQQMGKVVTAGRSGSITQLAYALAALFKNNTDKKMELLDIEVANSKNGDGKLNETLVKLLQYGNLEDFLDKKLNWVVANLEEQYLTAEKSAQITSGESTPTYTDTQSSAGSEKEVSEDKKEGKALKSYAEEAIKRLLEKQESDRERESKLSKEKEKPESNESNGEVQARAERRGRARPEEMRRPEASGFKEWKDVMQAFTDVINRKSQIGVLGEKLSTFIKTVTIPEADRVKTLLDFAEKSNIRVIYASEQERCDKLINMFINDPKISSQFKAYLETVFKVAREPKSNFIETGAKEKIVDKEDEEAFHVEDFDWVSEDYDEGGKTGITIKKSEKVMDFKKQREIVAEWVDKIDNSVIKTRLLQNLYQPKVEDIYAVLPNAKEMERLVKEINQALSSPEGMTEKKYLQAINKAFPNKSVFTLLEVPKSYFQSKEGEFKEAMRVTPTPKSNIAASDTQKKSPEDNLSKSSKTVLRH